MVNVLLLFLVLIVGFQSVCAQNKREFDSLDRVLHRTQSEISQVSILCKLANVYMPSSQKRGMRYAQHALWLAEKNKYQRGMAMSYEPIGTFYDLQSNYSKSLDYYLKALRIYESLNARQDIARCQMWIATLYGHQKEHRQMLDHALKAYELRTAVTDKKQFGHLLHILGLAYCYNGDFTRAMTYSMQALETDKAINHPLGIAHDFRGIAKIYFKQKKYAQAISHHLQALKGFEEIGHQRGIVWSLHGLAATYQEQGNYNEALKYYERSIAPARDAELKNELMHYYEGTSQCYAALNDYTRAYRHNLQYMAMKDSIFNEQSARKVAEMQTRYEADQKQAAIELLNKDKLLQQEAYDKQHIVLRSFVAALVLIVLLVLMLLRNNQQKRRHNELLSNRNEEIIVQKREIEAQNATLLQQREEIEMHMEEIEAQSQQLHLVLIQMENQNHQLQASEHELLKLNSLKNKYFSILSHDLRNSFASLKAYVPLLQDRLSESHDDELLALFEEFKFSVRNINALLDNVLLWSLSQMNMMPMEDKHISLQSIVHENMSLFLPTAHAKNINMVNQTAQGVAVKVDENMLNSILRNLLSNAIKFTPVNGTITITSTPGEHEVEVSVSDSGIGIGKQEQYKLFHLNTNYTTTSTTKSAKGTGLGLVLCKEFVEKSGGRIWVESIPGQGCTFTFTLPLVRPTPRTIPAPTVSVPLTAVS